MDSINSILDVSFSSSVSSSRTVNSVFYHLVEEVGEVATAINRPEKVTEPPQSEIADVIVAAIDLLYLVKKEQNPNVTKHEIINELNRTVDNKLLKWIDGSIKQPVSKKSNIKKWWSKLWNI